MSNKTDKIKSKVQKLLAQAADREGTSEGEVFLARALELMAQYGFEERDLKSDSEMDEVIHRSFSLSGSYTDMQSLLISNIARALHCTGFHSSPYRSSAVTEINVFGLKRHVERVEMLYSMLTPHMVSGAMKLRSHGFPDASTVTKRRSYMKGFVTTIYVRLKEAESAVSDAGSEYALALLSDLEKAKSAMNEYGIEHGLSFGKSESRGTVDSFSYSSGASAGRGMDLGQERFAGKIAIGA